MLGEVHPKILRSFEIDQQTFLAEIDMQKMLLDGRKPRLFTPLYQFPASSRDIAIIDEIIGVGEIALADHRSSYPTVNELIKVVQEAKIGGLIGGKAGIANIHLGDNGPPFDLINEAIKYNGISYNNFLPTHCNRSRTVFNEAKKYAKEGNIDLTTSSYKFFPDIEVKPSEAVLELLDSGIPVNHITLSSDAGGSLPVFDKIGNLIKTGNGDPKSIFYEMMDIIRADDSKIEEAVKIESSNVANILKLENKGNIKPGYDADLIVLNSERTDIDQLYINGLKINENKG